MSSRGDEIQNAAAHGDVEKIEALFNADAACLRYADAMGCIPIHFAAGAGEVGALRLLHRLDPSTLDVTDTHGWTPMHCASAPHKKDALLALHRLGSEAYFISTKLGNGAVSFWRDDENPCFLRLLYFSRSLAEVLFFSCADDEIKRTRRR